MGWWQELAAGRRLRQGQIIVHPTEGVFGLACRALDVQALRRVSNLKQRSPKQPFIVVVADFQQIEYAVDLTRIDLTPISAGWPGPETWVFPASQLAPRWLTGDDCTIAVRVTGHPQFARLCSDVGPIVSTSANTKGRRPALNLLQARRYFGGSVDFYLGGKLTVPGRPSRIRVATSGLSLRS